MNTLAEHENEFSKGVISKDGVRALVDAEIYGNVSSVGAMEKALSILYKALIELGVIEVHHPVNGKSYIKSNKELENWCRKYFPSANWKNVQNL